MALNYKYVDCDASRSNILISNIIQDINNGYKVLILMRGLPGSGKSTLSKNIVQSTVENSPFLHILSTDDYFRGNGKYNYDVNKLGEAHSWNQIRAKKSMTEGLSPIIIDNTNLELWEMRPYAIPAINNGYILKILEVKTPWAFQANELARRNSHNVPIAKIKKMLEKYQRNISVEAFLNFYDLKYSPQNTPPILRQLPCINTMSQNSNGPTDNSQKSSSSKWSQDLIDLREENDWLIAEPKPLNNNIPFDAATENKSSSSNDSNESWMDSWCTVKDDGPKPQRNPSRGLMNSTLHDPKSPNWAPINTLLTTWTDPGATSSQFSSALSDNMTVYSDASTMTSDDVMNSGHEILTARNRDINDGVSPRPVLPKSVPTFDKGVMTSEYEELQSEVGDEARERSLMELQMLFNDIPEDYMSYVLDKYQGDINLAIDVLLEAKKSDVDFSQYVGFQEIKRKNPPQRSDRDASTSSSTESADKTPSRKVNDQCKNHKLTKNDKNLPHMDEMLKKQINFEFGDEHYSEHSMKIRKKMQKKGGRYVEDEATTSNSEHLADHSVSESSDDSENGEKIISFRMGREFFQQLDEQYGTSSAWDENLEPIIHIPENLLNQIHALWLESMCNQLEVQQNYVKVMMEEDEQLARELELKEREEKISGEEPAVANISDIMDMEYALANYDAGQTCWEESPDDLATKLTEQKLQQMFPEIEQCVLTEVYRAHNNDFEQTFHVLLLSTGKLTSSQIESTDQRAMKKLYSDMERDLLERAKQKENELSKHNIFDDDEHINYTDAEGNQKYIGNKEAVSMFRQQASHYLNLRNVNFSKARDCMMKGLNQCAQYYHRMAVLYVKKHDYFNNLAASRLMQASSTGRDNYTLDLHYMYVVEALEVLDLFLDKHITQLKESSHKVDNLTLFLITGRGRHSKGGQPRIKPAVKKHLDEQGLNSYEVNPGLLGVFISPNTVLHRPGTSK